MILQCEKKIIDPIDPIISSSSMGTQNEFTRFAIQSKEKTEKSAIQEKESGKKYALYMNMQKYTLKSVEYGLNNNIIYDTMFRRNSGETKKT